MPDPATARPRPDLTFLRHRSRPRPALPQPAAPHSEPAPISFARPDRAPAAPTAPAAPAAPTASASHPISFARPGRGSSSLLDLSGEPADRPATATPARVPQPARRAITGARVAAGRQHLLTVEEPTVVLTRVQSGVGMLEIEAAVSAQVGDLRLGAAYELATGHTSTVQLASNGNRFAPSSRRPVVVAGRDEFDHLRIDLRQIRTLCRMAVYAFSESRTELDWGGTLVVSTSAGARIELPLEHLFRGRIAVPLTLYVVDGRLVIRAEMETIAGDVREAARAYGFDRITWRDDRTPVDP